MLWRFALPAISNWKQLGVDAKSEVSPSLLLDDELLRAMIRHISSEKFVDFPISLIFPISLNVARIEDLNLPTPIKNLFLREGFFLTSDFKSITLGQFLSFKNCGPTKVESLVASLTEYTIRNANGGPAPADMNLEDIRGSGSNVPIDAASELHSERVLSGVRPLMDYFVYSGFVDVSTSEPELLAKLNVHEKTIHSFLFAFLQSEAGQSLEAPPPAHLFDAFMREFVTSTLQQDIFSSRLSALEPDTLELVGRRNGVTREAVRQSEKRIVKNFEKTLVNNPRLNSLVRSVQARLVAPKTFTEVMNQDFFGLSNDKYNFFLSLVGLQQIQEFNSNYCSDFSYFQKELKASAITSAGTLGIFNVSEFAQDVLRKFPSISKDYPEQWMSQHDYASYLNHGIEGNSIRAWALLVLYTRNLPLTSAEIAELIPLGKSRAYLESQLADDPTFIRPEKSKWGLSIWGLEEYTSISDLIGKHLDLHGSTRIDTLVQKLVQQFNVKESSVRVAAQSQGFQVVDGWVKRSNVQRERG